jgi:hypothetical protein
LNKHIIIPEKATTKTPDGINIASKIPMSPLLLLAGVPVLVRINLEVVAVLAVIKIVSVVISGTTKVVVVDDFVVSGILEVCFSVVSSGCVNAVENRVVENVSEVVGFNVVEYVVEKSTVDVSKSAKLETTLVVNIVVSKVLERVEA